MLTALVILVVSVLGLYLLLRKPQHLAAAAQKIPGPSGYPLVGNALELGINTTVFLAAIKQLCREYYGKTFKFWLGNHLFVTISTPEDVAIILGSNTQLNKPLNYKFTHPWIGTGLLTSPGEKWKRHRKILMPTFHFKILEEFANVFHANGEILVDNLKDHVGGPAFDIHGYVTLYALDNICETAMGVKINAMQDSESEYVKAIRDQSDITMQRIFKPWLGLDFIFNMTSLKRKQDRSLKILHDTTNGVIRSRQAAIAKERSVNSVTNQSLSQASEDGVKRRMAFLDLLLESTLDGSGLTDEDIREEVNTFMFAGHDTAAACITYTLWLLSWHQDIQDDVVKELEEVWPDPKEPLPYRCLQDLKYLERVIKEVLRLYPSVPFYGRLLTEDTALTGGVVAPKDATAFFAPIMIHRDPAIYPDPEKFDPDRFLPENVKGRHPYSYVPFSAGPRNCIGQKFALVEMKSSLAHALRSYKFLPGSPKQELTLSAELILTSKAGVPVKIVERH